MCEAKNMRKIFHRGGNFCQRQRGKSSDQSHLPKILSSQCDLNWNSNWEQHFKKYSLSEFATSYTFLRKNASQHFHFCQMSHILWLVCQCQDVTLMSYWGFVLLKISINSWMCLACQPYNCTTINNDRTLHTLLKNVLFVIKNDCDYEKEVKLNSSGKTNIY